MQQNRAKTEQTVAFWWSKKKMEKAAAMPMERPTEPTMPKDRKNRNRIKGRGIFTNEAMEFFMRTK